MLRRTDRPGARPVSSRRRRRRGFTLIELLVVVSITLLLVGLLLPALNRARDAARLAGCLSNNRQIGIALEGYLADENEAMPIGPSLRDGAEWFRGYGFGGRMPAAESLLRGGPDEAPPPADRPLNAYVHGGDERTLRPDSQAERDAIDLPGFACPADRVFNYQEDFFANVARWTMSNYDAAGTSYSFNVIWQRAGYDRREAERRMRQLRATRADVFVPVLDDSAEWILWLTRTNGVAHHGDDERHVLLYFDGHAGLRPIDPFAPMTTDYSVLFDADDLAAW